MGMKGTPRRGQLRVQLAMGNAEPSLGNRDGGLGGSFKGDLLIVRREELPKTRIMKVKRFELKKELGI